MEFYLALVGSGLLTPRLFVLRIGDPLWLGPKITGMFTFDQVPPSVNVVMIATGTGLAPYMSMLGTHLMCGDGNRRFAVLHGARHSWDLGYRSELLNLQHICPNFTYIPTISRPADEPVPWTGHTGYVQEPMDAGCLEASVGVPPYARKYPCFPVWQSRHDRRNGHPAGRGRLLRAHQEAAGTNSRRTILVDHYSPWRSLCP